MGWTQNDWLTGLLSTDVAYVVQNFFMDYVWIAVPRQLAMFGLPYDLLPKSMLRCPTDVVVWCSTMRAQLAGEPGSFTVNTPHPATPVDRPDSRPAVRPDRKPDPAPGKRKRKKR